MKASIVRALMVALATWSAAQGLAAWDQKAVDAGGIPGQEIAISSATSLAYIPLLQQRALAVFDGERMSRIELDIKPTTVGYSEATGRLFVLGMFDNAVIAIDEATGSKTRLAVGSYPDNIIVDDVRGKVYVSTWGGIRGQGGLAVIDSRSLAVRDVPLGGYVTGMALDPETGNLFLTGETPIDRSSFLAALDSEGNVVAREDTGYQAYSLAVDSRTGYVYLAGLSERPTDNRAVDRIFSVYAQPGLQLVTRHAWPTGADLFRLNFLVDPAEPGLYFSSGQSTTLLRLDAEGRNLKTWQLPLGNTLLEDGRTVINGIFGLDADPATGHIFVSSPVGSLVAEFDPTTGAADVVGIPGAVGFSAVHFWPDSTRMLVTDGAGDFQLTLLRRSSLAP